jgi:peptidoglycan/xylan/chitin deacetylase (PgdA/CDA1 family)
MKNFAKSFCGYISSNNIFFREKIKQGLAIFVFHDVNDNPTKFQKEYKLSVTKSQFSSQLDWIQDNFEVISPKSLFNHSSQLKGKAILTFDDGYMGAFQSGMPLIQSRGLSALFFLNIGHIKNRTPLISALTAYLAENFSSFRRFCESYFVKHPYHLYLTPVLLNIYFQKFKIPPLAAVENFAGKLIDINTLYEWENKNVFYANHLYEHWNYFALSDFEFKEQILLNQIELREFSNHLDLFAFTNGMHPDLNSFVIDRLKSYGIQRVFTSKNGVNFDIDSFYMGRIPMSDFETSLNNFWFRLFRSA